MKYDEYLSDESVYISLENKVKEIFLNAVDNDNGWSFPYYNTSFSNGKLFMDGNPIFSAKNGNKIVKIVLDEDFEDVTFFKEDKFDCNKLVVIANIKSLDKIGEIISKWAST